MKFLEDFFVKVFSIIILILSIFVLLVRLELVKVSLFSSLITFLFSTKTKAKITYIVLFIFILVSMKIILTRRGKPKNGKDGIILENGSGKLIISKESLDNLILNASKDIIGTESISSKTYLDLEQNLRVYVTVSVASDVSIKDISTKLQSKIKSAIKQTADLDVSEVNVKIKNIVNKKKRIPKELNIIKQEPEEKIQTNSEEIVPKENNEILNREDI